MQQYDNKSMFYGAKPQISEKAKQLRSNMTEAEKILWKRLRRKQIDGYHFRAQYQIDLFIADFYCHRLKLIIELDGEVHSNEDQRQYDEGRTAELERLGIKVIRFRNKQVLQNPDTVEDEIKQVCQVR